MKTTMKKVLCMLIAGILCIAVLSGCGAGNSAGEQTADGSAVQSQISNEGVILKGKNVEVTADLFGYYLYVNAINEIFNQKPEFDGDFSTLDWDMVTDSGETLSDKIKAAALDELEKKIAVLNYGNENGLGLTDDEKKELENSMNQFKEEQGEEAFANQLKIIGVHSVEAYNKIYEAEVVYSKVKNAFEADRDKYIKDEDDLKKYKDDENVCVKHILIMNDSEKHEDPKAAIEEVLNRAKSGEDFDALIKEFNEDGGEGEAGYSFGPGEMVPEFEAASFALDYDQISDVVQSDYGYHIIKRIVGFAEFENYLIDKAKIERNEDAVKNISLADIFAEIEAASEKLDTATEDGGEESVG